MQECFGEAISKDITERNHRFLEESLELVQSLGATASEARQLVDYVFGRHVGDAQQEVGGVMVTLAALCLAAGFDMHKCGEVELARVWGRIAQIREKQAQKPKHSPLPSQPEPITEQALREMGWMESDKRERLWINDGFNDTDVEIEYWPALKDVRDEGEVRIGEFVLSNITTIPQLRSLMDALGVPGK